MNARPILHLVNNDIISAYRTVYGDDLEAVYLYGSYARHDEDDESDIDYVALIKRIHPDIKKGFDQLWDITGDIDLEHEVVVSAMAVEADDFYQNAKSFPYYINILKDGIKIYEKSRKN